jgi:hypothetical protein
MYSPPSTQQIPYGRNYENFKTVGLPYSGLHCRWSYFDNVPIQEQYCFVLYAAP